MERMEDVGILLVFIDGQVCCDSSFLQKDRFSF